MCYNVWREEKENWSFRVRIELVRDNVKVRLGFIVRLSKCHGLGQVIFQNNFIAGAFLLIFFYLIV